MPKFKDKITGCTIRYGTPQTVYCITISTDKEEITGSYFSELELMDIHGADDFSDPLEQIDLPQDVRDKLDEEDAGTLNIYFSSLIGKRLMKRKQQ